jgi:SAM-dependent methyltransferase
MTAILDQPSTDTMEAAGALAGRLVATALGSMELMTVQLGLVTGLYAALAESPRTPSALAAATGITERYCREWLEQQAMAGLVEVDDATAAPDAREYHLPAATALVLAAPGGPFDLTPLVRLLGAAGLSMPAVTRAWQEGRGLSFAEYGDDLREAQGAFNRGDYQQRLVQEWVPLLGLSDTLARPGARVLELGCGVGYAAVALAHGFPGLSVVGIDSDEASVTDAREHAAAEGVSDRVRFEALAADSDLGAVAGSCDAVFVLEALHDMAHPVAALAAARDCLADDGCVVVLDEAVADEFAPPGPGEEGPLPERLFYASSVLHCLPVGLSEDGSAGTGAVMRPATLRAYAAEAGLTRVEVVDIGHDLLRCYVLRR